MTLQERQAIELLFARLADAQRLPQPRDEEAARFIRSLIEQQPDAPYLMAQTIIGQAQVFGLTQTAPEANTATSEVGRGLILNGFLATAMSVALSVNGAIALETKSS